MKYTVRIVSLLLAICLLIVPLAGCAPQRRPLNYLKSVIERSFKKSLGGEVAALLLEALDGGSVSLSWRGNEPIGGVDAAKATVYFDREAQRVAAESLFTLGDKNYDASLWLSDKSVVASSAAFFGSTTLGVDLHTLEADLAHSIFRNDSGTAYAVPEIGEGSADAVHTLVQGFFSLYAATEDMGGLADKHIGVFLKNLTEHGRCTRYAEDGKHFIYLAVDNSMLSCALRDTWARAVKDKALCRRLREIASTRDAMQSAKEGVVYTEWTMQLENWLQNDAQIEALCARIDASAPFLLELNATVKKLTGTLESIGFSYRVDEANTAFSLDLSKKDTLSLSMIRGGVSHSLTYQTVNDGWQSYDADLTYTKAGADGTVLTWQGDVLLDKKQDAFSLTLSQNERTRVLSGTFCLDGDAFSLSVDRVSEGEQVSPFSLGISILKKAKMPESPQYVNLATVGEQRIDPVAARAKEAHAALRLSLDKTAFTKKSVLGALLAPLRFEA